MQYETASFQNIDERLMITRENILNIDSINQDTKELIAMLMIFRDSASRFFKHLNVVITESIVQSSRRLRERQSSNDVIDMNTIFDKELLIVLQALCHELMQVINTLLTKVDLLSNYEDDTRFQDSFRPQVANLFIQGPKRKLNMLNLQESLASYRSLCTGVDHVVNLFHSLLATKTAESISLEDLFYLGSIFSSKSEHLLARSLFHGLMHLFGVRLHPLLLSSMKQRQMPSSVTENNLVKEWLGGNPTAVAWETFKIFSVNRNKLQVKLVGMLSHWGVVGSEALYVDEQLGQQQEQPNAQCCSSWVLIFTTTLMDMYMKILCEGNLLQCKEYGYFYWYWDYIASVNAHAIDKLRYISFLCITYYLYLSLLLF